MLDLGSGTLKLKAVHRRLDDGQPHQVALRQDGAHGVVRVDHDERRYVVSGLDSPSATLDLQDRLTCRGRTIQVQFGSNSLTVRSVRQLSSFGSVNTDLAFVRGSGFDGPDFDGVRVTVRVMVRFRVGINGPGFDGPDSDAPGFDK